MGTGRAQGAEGVNTQPWRGQARLGAKGKEEVCQKQMLPGGKGLWTRAMPFLTQLAQLWKLSWGRPRTVTQKAGGFHPFTWAILGSTVLLGGAGP